MGGCVWCCWCALCAHLLVLVGCLAGSKGRASSALIAPFAGGLVMAPALLWFQARVRLQGGAVNAQKDRP